MALSCQNILPRIRAFRHEIKDTLGDNISKKREDNNSVSLARSLTAIATETVQFSWKKNRLVEWRVLLIRALLNMNEQFKMEPSTFSINSVEMCIFRREIPVQRPKKMECQLFDTFELFTLTHFMYGEWWCFNVITMIFALYSVCRTIKCVLYTQWHLVIKI